MHPIFLFFHLIGVVLWVGGMFFAHMTLRPSAAELLQPPLRLPLLAATLGRFFTWVSVSIVLILVSGVAIMVLFASNGGRTVDIISGGVGQVIGDYTLGAVYGEVKGNLALMPLGAGWSTYVSGGAKFNNQFTTWTARGGVGYRW